MKYDIHMYGDPVLREEADPVEAVDAELRKLAEDMVETMRDARGVGLAAQQIGKTTAICVIEVPPDYDVDGEGVRLNPELEMPLALLNPRIVEFSPEKDVHDEGCLSFPGIDAPIQRSTEVVIEYMDIEGQQHRRTFRGFIARVAQHEIDHLNGVLFIDRISQIKRIALSGRLKRMRKKTQAEIVNG